MKDALLDASILISLRDRNFFFFFFLPQTVESAFPAAAFPPEVSMGEFVHTALIQENPLLKGGLLLLI